MRRQEDAQPCDCCGEATHWAERYCRGCREAIASLKERERERRSAEASAFSHSE